MADDRTPPEEQPQDTPAGSEEQAPAPVDERAGEETPAAAEAPVEAPADEERPHGDPLAEDLSLAWTTVNGSYHPQNADGSPGAPVTFDYPPTP